MDKEISTGLLEVNHKELNSLIKQYYQKKLFLMIYGTFGVGKSTVVLKTAKEIAKSKGKTLVEWNKINKDEKLNLVQHPEGKFVLIDERLSQYDSSDIRGLPDFNGLDTVDWKMPLWAKMVTTEGSDGLLFFDEMNHAISLVISSAYQVILDRIVTNCPIAKDWLILGAGNLESDNSNTFDFPPPMKDRGGEVQLKLPSSEDWCDWAITAKIDPRIIAFISYKGSYLYQVDHTKDNKYTTPRGWERVSRLIEGVENLNEVDLLVQTAIGKDIANQFTSFCRIKDKINLDVYLKDPKKIKELDKQGDAKSMMYFVTGIAAEKYGEEKIGFDKIEEFVETFDVLGYNELSVVLFKLAKQYNINKFTKDFSNPTSKTVFKFAKQMAEP